MLIEPTILIAFVIASAILLVIPGPTIIMVISQALAHGRKTAFASVLGVGLGDLAAASLSLLGVGTILAASASAFTFVKLAGAAYLIWIGISLWRTPIDNLKIETHPSDEMRRSYGVFRDAFLVTLFNPKGIVFFIAFVPQFISAQHPFAPQAVIFVLIFVLLGMLNAAFYAMLAGSARLWIKQPSVLRIATRVGAAFLISAGVASVFVERAT